MSDLELCEPLVRLAKSIARRVAETRGRPDPETLRPASFLATFVGEEERALVAALDDAMRTLLERRAVAEAIASLGFAANPSRWRTATDLMEFWQMSPYGPERAGLADRLLADGVIRFGDDPPCQIDVRPEYAGPVDRNLFEELVEAAGVAAAGLGLTYGCVARANQDADAYAVVYAHNYDWHFVDFEDPASLAYPYSRRVLLVAGLQPTDAEVKSAMDALSAHDFVPVGLVSVVEPARSHGGHPFARFGLPFAGAFSFHRLMEHFLARGMLPRDRYEACLSYHRGAPSS